MPDKIKELSENSLPDLVKALGKESDRGAVVLAGSYIENLLALGLESKLVVKKKALTNNLFGAHGAFSTFSQRIDICEALGFLKPEICKELREIKKVRNEFSHHPFEAKFTDDAINKLICRLRLSEGMGIRRLKRANGNKSRECYLLSCGLTIANIKAAFSLTSVSI